jgi:hypothetical protein
MSTYLRDTTLVTKPYPCKMRLARSRGWCGQVNDLGSELARDIYLPAFFRAFVCFVCFVVPRGPGLD